MTPERPADRSGELHREPRGDRLRSDFEAEAAKVSAIPVVQVRGIVSVLRTLGWSATDAQERVLAAVELFESQGNLPSEDALLKRALSFRL